MSFISFEPKQLTNLYLDVKYLYTDIVNNEIHCDISNTENNLSEYITIEMENNSVNIKHLSSGKKITLNYIKVPTKTDYSIILDNKLSNLIIFTDDITTNIIYNKGIYTTEKKVKDIISKYIVFEDNTFLIFTTNDPQLFEGKRIFTLKELHRDEYIFYEYKIGSKSIIIFKEILSNSSFIINLPITNISVNKEKYILSNEQTNYFTTITKEILNLCVKRTNYVLEENINSITTKIFQYYPFFITIESFNGKSFDALVKFFSDKTYVFKFLATLKV